MKLHVLQEAFVVCRLAAAEGVALKPYTFLSVTPDEVSLVCPEADAPADTLDTERGWRALKVDGILPFSMVGLIAGISGVLAQNGFALFVVSTYNTDYILLKADTLPGALKALEGAGYEIA